LTVATRQPFRALHEADFCRYYLGQVVSSSGTFMQSTALGWLVLQETGSAAKLGIVIAAGSLPTLVIVPAGTSVAALGLALATSFNALLYFKQYLAKPSSRLYKQAFLPTWPNDFAADVAAGTLPQVSWLLPSIIESEHPNGSPIAGEHYVSQVLATLFSNPDVWSNTVVFLTYDENGGFFDHVVPPTPPPGTQGEEVAASVAPSRGGGGVGGPIGLGFRVPALMISPWSRGGYVDSTTFDHTSMLRFLETRFGVAVPNLTDWRRSVVGDLTSTLGMSSADTSPPSLAPAGPETSPGCPSDLVQFIGPPETIRVPGQQRIPTQEAGVGRRR
jgi:phospholipase C